MNVCCPAPIRHFLISTVSASSSLCSVDGIIKLMKNQCVCVCGGGTGSFLIVCRRICFFSYLLAAQLLFTHLSGRMMHIFMAV